MPVSGPAASISCRASGVRRPGGRRWKESTTRRRAGTGGPCPSRQRAAPPRRSASARLSSRSTASSSPGSRRPPGPARCPGGRLVPACGSHFAQSHRRPPPVLTATSTSSGACSTAIWQSSDRSQPGAVGAPSRLTTRRRAGPSRAGPDRAAGCVSRVRRAGAQGRPRRAGRSGAELQRRGQRAAPGPDADPQEVGVAGRRSHTRRRRWAMASRRSGLATARRPRPAGPGNRAGGLRTDARCARYRSRCRSWVARGWRICTRTPR